jgi:formylglycine-generating enzyme required for sulfatase activity
MKADKGRIFLCYAREDIKAVKAVYRKLSDAGFNPWMDKKDLLPGQLWQIETPKALKAARFVIIFFSEHSVSKRGYVQREFKLALDTLQEMPEEQLYIIPVRLDDCRVPESFVHIHYCDLFEEDGFELVLKTIQSQLDETEQPEEVGIPLEEHQRVLKELEGQKRQLELERKKLQEAEKEKRRKEQEALKRQTAGIKRPREKEDKATETPGEEPGLFSPDKFAKIPAGSFQMGSENGDEDEKPLHTVRITQSFYLGKYEVTQEQWEAVMGATVRDQRDKANKEWPLRGEGKNYPIYYVSWEDVQDFIGRLNQQIGRAIFRLPTEAEWEYACRAGTTADYAGNLDDMAWYGSNSGDKTHPVGTKQPNAWGLYDMHGNVWEWCSDWFKEDYYQNSPEVDPPGPPTGSRRVIRGGGWGNYARNCRSALRFNNSPGGRCRLLGFRLVRAVR